jgi:hypothetical protein
MNPSDYAWIAIGFAVAFILVAGWLVWEASLIRTGRKPITTYLRYTVMRYPGWALTGVAIFVFAIGALFGHVVWDAGCG